VQPLLEQQAENQQAVERESSVENNRFKPWHEASRYFHLCNKSQRAAVWGFEKVWMEVIEESY
jgi:hypothetical protein